MYMETTIGTEDNFEINIMRVKGVETVEVVEGGIQEASGTIWRKIVIGNLEINLFEG